MRVLCPVKVYSPGSVIARPILDQIVDWLQSQNSPSKSTEVAGAIPDMSGFDLVEYICTDIETPAIDALIGTDQDTEQVNKVNHVEVVTIDDKISIVPDDENNYIKYGDLKVTRDMVKSLAMGKKLTDELVDYIVQKMLDGHAADKLNLYNIYKVKSIQRNGSKANFGEIDSEKINMPHVFTVLNNVHYYLMIYFPSENQMVELNSLLSSCSKPNEKCRVKILAYLARIMENKHVHNAGVVIPNVSQQNDGSSCGLYLIHFLKVFLDTSMNLEDIRICEQAQHHYNSAHVLIDREKFFIHIDEEYRRLGKSPLEPIYFDDQYEMRAILGHSKSERGYELAIEWEGDFEPSTVPLSYIHGTQMLEAYFMSLDMPIPPEVLGHIAILERDVFSARGMKKVGYHQIPTSDGGIDRSKCTFQLSDIPENYTVKRDESFVRLSNDGQYSNLYAPKEFIRAEQTFTGSKTNNCLQVVCSCKYP